MGDFSKKKLPNLLFGDLFDDDVSSRTLLTEIPKIGMTRFRSVNFKYIFYELLHCCFAVN